MDCGDEQARNRAILGFPRPVVLLVYSECNTVHTQKINDHAPEDRSGLGPHPQSFSWNHHHLNSG